MSNIEQLRPRVSDWMLVFFGLVFISGILYLMTSLYDVQVRNVAQFVHNQKVQSLRRVMVPGARGRIVTEGGDVLADSRPSYSIVCYVNEYRRRGNWSNTVDAVDVAVSRLANSIKVPRRLSYEQIERHIRNSLAMPLVVYRDVDLDTLSRFAERSTEFPGFAEYVQAERIYPQGTLAAHILGGVRRDRPDRDGADAGSEKVHFYLPENRGRSGIEHAYDDYMVGVPGERLVRVDASGYSRSEWIGSYERPGLDLIVTIDLEMQKAMENGLHGLCGAGVAIDPRDGSILAMASAPTFNPNTFSADYNDNVADRRKPLLNRATSEYYAPGSTFKPITALAALQHSIDPLHALQCTGVYSLGAWHLRCSSRWGHGDVAMERGLEVSCNSYFCEIGREVGVDGVAAAAREFGLGSRTGLDIGGEKAGTVPDPQWKREHKPGEGWVTGDTCQMSIGQGMLQVTPLQMAVACAALANGGKVYAPHLRANLPGSGTPIRTLSFTKDQIETVRHGMRMVVERGTGRRIRSREDADGKWHPLAVKCAGKTGTAEVGSGARRRKNTWIIAFAPYDNPTVAVAMVIENGQSGGLTTAPKVHDVLAARFGEGAITDSSIACDEEADD